MRNVDVPYLSMLNFLQFRAGEIYETSDIHLGMFDICWVTR